MRGGRLLRRAKKNLLAMTDGHREDSEAVSSFIPSYFSWTIHTKIKILPPLFGLFEPILSYNTRGTISFSNFSNLFFPGIGRDLGVSLWDLNLTIGSGKWRLNMG
jgi:hypothetical protein